jgi:hydroxymethylbilane synthase
LAVAAERAVSRAMGGSCSMPLAAHATLDQGHLRIDAAWGNPDDLHAPLLRAHTEGLASDFAQAEQLGLQVAAQLRAQGAA